jgi:S-adenosylmethionine decarboxylase
MILVFEGYDCNPEILSDEDVVAVALREVAKIVDMKVIQDNGVLSYLDIFKPNDWGVTGTVVIAESHIAIHTWPKRHYLHFVLDSCRDFDMAFFDIVTYLMNVFEIKKHDYWILSIGLKDALEKGLAQVAATS